MSQGAAGDRRLDRLLTRIAAELERRHVPGLQLIAVRDGETLLASGVGVRGVSDRDPIDSSTLFHHGSCGKGYTALLAVLLHHEGVLDLDAPVRRYVPELRLPDPVIAERVTTRDLLSHRAGLSRHDLAWICNPTWSREELVARMAHLPMAGDLRAKWQYSNFGYTLAGLVIGRATNSTWEAELRTRVLVPLGMTRTMTSVDAFVADDNHAEPHLLRDDAAVPTAHRRFDGTAPAGQLITSADDGARWLALHAGPRSDGGPVRSEVVAATHALHIPVSLEGPGAALLGPLSLQGYALGWVTGTFRGRPILWHNGGVDGFRTELLVLPDERLAVGASANLHASTVPLAAVLDLTETLIGEAPCEDPSWYERLAGAPDDAPSPPRARRGRRASHDLEAYAGTYEHPGYGSLLVAIVNGGLDVRLGESPFAAHHRHYDTWDLRYEPLDVELPLTFATGPDGEISEAVLPLEPGAEPIRFTPNPLGGASPD